MAEQPDISIASARTVFVDVPAPYRSVASFVAALQQGEVPAMRAFYSTFAPLLRDQARRAGVSCHDVDGIVGTVLGDVLLRLIDIDRPPRDLTRYVVTALRNHARNERRAHARQRGRDERAYDDRGGGGQRLVAECHSAYGIRTSLGVMDDADHPLRRAIVRLARYSAQAMGPDDAALMIGVSRHLPIRELGAQLGLTYANARVRVHRLRTRFAKLVPQYVAELDDEERGEMERFLRRAGVALHDAGATPGPARSPRRGPKPAPDVPDAESDR